MKRIIITLIFITTLSIFANAQVVTASHVNGTWRSTTSTKSVFTEFRIQSIGNGKLKVGFWGNNAVKGFSNVVIGTADIDGVTAIFQPKDAQVDESSPCVMTLKFTGGKLTVKEKGNCGWGNGISSDGTFKKTGSAKPNFKELEQMQ